MSISKDILYYFDKIRKKPVEKAKTSSISYIKEYLLVEPSKLKKTPPGSDIVHLRLTTGVIVGHMGSGKTTLALTLAKYIEDYYTKKGYNVKTILSIDFLSALNTIEKGDEIIILIIDDAPTKYLAGGRQRSDEEYLRPYYLIRHLAVRKSNWEALYCALFFNTQRYMSLDINFRNAPLKMFKTLLFDPHEFGDARQLFLSDYLGYLKDLTIKILIKHLDSYKSYFIYKLGNLQGIVKVPFTAKPRNLINLRDEREFVLDNVMEQAKTSLKDSDLVCEIAKRMGRAGWTWTKARKFIKKLREAGIKYTEQRVYECWKKGREEMG